jgi:hypothetical protein
VAMVGWMLDPSKSSAAASVGRYVSRRYLSRVAFHSSHSSTLTMEKRFLASQAERLADNKRRLQKSRQNQLRSNDGGGQTPSLSDNYFVDDAPNLCDEDDNANIIVNDVDVATNNDHHSSQKEKGHRFWMNFRKLRSELQSQVDALLLISPDEEGGAATTADGDSGGVNNYEAAKAYYSTAARRSEGRTRLDCILDNVRLLRRHCLSSSSVLPSTTKRSDNDDITANNQPLLLSSILSTPMPDMTQTDVRLVSEEIDRLLKCIDEARAIISPKEKFVFKRYRKAMEEKSRLLLGEGENVSSGSQPSNIDDDGVIRKETNVAYNDDQDKETFNHDGGVLENKSDCIIEIFPDDNIQVNKASKSQIQYYSLPRRINSLHPPTFNNSNNTQQHNTSSSSSSSGSMSYLLQNLTNVTILLHGSRPTLHIKNIHKCHIYVTEPTLGPVHITNCHSSQIRCSCYQLRIHDSINVKFGVWVRSGPIIENCKEMVFEGDYYSGDGGNNGGVGKNNMYWDVKDFNWLRALRKSPNFVVVASKVEESGLNGGELVPEKEDVGAKDSDEMPLQEEEEEHSEDEL